MINRWLTSLLAVALMARSLAQDIPQDGPDEAPSNPCFQPVNNINIGGCSVTPAAFGELLNISRAILELLQNQQPCRTQSPTVNTPVLNPPRDCAELQENGVEGSGVYTIYPDEADGPLDVYCDMETDGGGWTVIQRRQDGSVDFYRDWDEYKNGFGNVSSEHWLGNENIHRLSTQNTYELRFDLEDWQGETRYAVYNDFSIGDEDAKYVLNVGEYTGDAGNDVAYHNGKAFTTKDRDNDSYHTNCAVQFTGAWWYKWCVTTNLNAQYYNGGTSPYGRGMIWNSWHGNYYSLKKTEMKIRPL